ncbi:MAG: cytochrome c peroxidase [Myxococcales bacterium]
MTRRLNLAAALMVACVLGCDDRVECRKGSSGGGGPACQQETAEPLVRGEAPPGFPAGPLGGLGPADNVLTEARAQLGKRLFFETRLSRDNTVSCGTCHQQRYAFAEPTAVSTGVDQRQGARNAPALVNLAWGESFFWDGRARTLEDQAGGPIENPLEMDLKLPVAVDRLRGDDSYVKQFQEAYGDGPSEETLRKALASFVRTLVSGDSPYDRFLRDGETSAFDEKARAGEALFFSERTACFHCHPPGALTNEGFFNDGSFVVGLDVGRQAITGRSGDLGKFKVPGLRNIAVTAPYMHDGSLATLDQVLDRYDRGGLGHPSTDPQIQPLSLTPDDREALLAFLNALTDQTFLSDSRFQTRSPDTLPSLR